MKGYKMVRDNYTAFYDMTTKYTVGETIEIKNPAPASEGKYASGLHISKEPHNPLNYNAKYPWRLLEVSYNKKDIIFESDDKIRVRKLKVIKELEPWEIGLPDSKRVFDKIAATSEIRMRAQTEARKKKIEKLVGQHVARLNRYYGEQKVILKGVRFYTIKEWASVWASVWDSVWDSVRASVRDSVWASVRDSVWASVWTSFVEKDASNPFLPLQKICETGGVFYGIDKDGIAHIIMPDKSEVN